MPLLVLAVNFIVARPFLIIAIPLFSNFIPTEFSWENLILFPSRFLATPSPLTIFTLISATSSSPAINDFLSVSINKILSVIDNVFLLVEILALLSSFSTVA